MKLFTATFLALSTFQLATASPVLSRRQDITAIQDGLLNTVATFQAIVDAATPASNSAEAVASTFDPIYNIANGTTPISNLIVPQSGATVVFGIGEIICKVIYCPVAPPAWADPTPFLDQLQGWANSSVPISYVDDVAEITPNEAQGLISSLTDLAILSRTKAVQKRDLAGALHMAKSSLPSKRMDIHIHLTPTEVAIIVALLLI